jgi:hypothetical protein
MRVQVEFNDKGEIQSVSGCVTVKMPDGSTGRSGRRARPGHAIAEFEVAEVQRERDFEGLREVKAKYCVKGHPHHPTLEAKGT